MHSDGVLTHATRHYGAEQYKEKALPLFVSGQSLGGLIAASAVRKDPARFAGLVLFSPAIDVDMTLNMRIQSLFGLPLAALLPWVRSVPAVNIEDLSDDPEVRARRRALPCNLHRTAS